MSCPSAQRRRRHRIGAAARSGGSLTALLASQSHEALPCASRFFRSHRARATAQHTPRPPATAAAGERTNVLSPGLALECVCRTPHLSTPPHRTRPPSNGRGEVSLLRSVSSLPPPAPQSPPPSSPPRARAGRFSASRGGEMGRLSCASAPSPPRARCPRYDDGGLAPPCSDIRMCASAIAIAIASARYLGVRAAEAPGVNRTWRMRRSRRQQMRRRRRRKKKRKRSPSCRRGDPS